MVGEGALQRLLCDGCELNGRKAAPTHRRLFGGRGRRGGVRSRKRCAACARRSRWSQRGRLPASHAPAAAPLRPKRHLQCLLAFASRHAPPLHERGRRRWRGGGLTEGGGGAVDVVDSVVQQRQRVRHPLCLPCSRTRSTQSPPPNTSPGRSSASEAEFSPVRSPLHACQLCATSHTPHRHVPALRLIHPSSLPFEGQPSVLLPISAIRNAVIVFYSQLRPARAMSCFTCLGFRVVGFAKAHQQQRFAQTLREAAQVRVAERESEDPGQDEVEEECVESFVAEQHARQPSRVQHASSRTQRPGFGRRARE
eukprot:3908910-Rhodomonas_salina.2